MPAGKGFTAMGGLKLYPPLLKFMGIDGLVDIKRRKELSVSFSPFGWVDEGGTVFVKGAPIVKFMTRAEMKAAGGSYAKIEAGLGKAITISKAHTEKGVAIVNIRGRWKRMPAKAAEMMKVGKRAALVKAVTVFA